MSLSLQNCISGSELSSNKISSVENRLYKTFSTEHKCGAIIIYLFIGKSINKTILTLPNYQFFFRSFAFLKIFCLSLNRASLQKKIFGLFLAFLPTLCACCITTISMSNYFFKSERTLLSHSSQLSSLSSFDPSNLMLFRLEQSCSSTSLL